MPNEDVFRTLADAIRDRFQSQKRVLTYWEFLDEVRADPYGRLRSAAQYLRDMLDHFGQGQGFAQAEFGIGGLEPLQALADAGACGALAKALIAAELISDIVGDADIGGHCAINEALHVAGAKDAVILGIRVVKQVAV